MSSKNIFIICTVRNASVEYRQRLEWYVATLEHYGHIVHLPHRDTDQKQKGIDICNQNRQAILRADEIHIFYNPDSQGTHFDMGMAFALNKKIIIVNSIPFGPEKSFARMLSEWETLQGEKMLISENFEKIGLSPIVEISERAKSIADEYQKQTGKSFIYFQRGEVGFRTPEYITNAIKRYFDDGRTGYPKSGGDKIFKNSVKQHLIYKYSIALKDDNILCTYGGQEGLQLSFGLLKEKKTLAFGPCWSCMLENIWPYTNTEYYLYNLSAEDNFAIDFDSLEYALSKVDVLYLNTPHNPTGKVFTLREIARINELCQKYNVFIVSDEAYADIVFDDVHTSLLQFDNPNSISVFTFSKSFAATGLRIGYTVSRNPELIQLMTRGNYTQTAGVVTPIQLGFAHALHQEEECQKWLTYYINMLRERRDVLYNELKDFFDIKQPQGAFYCFIDINSYFTDIPISERDKFITDFFLQNGIAIVPGSAFGSAYTGYIRLSFSTLTKELIQEGVRRMIYLLKERKNDY